MSGVGVRVDLLVKLKPTLSYFGLLSVSFSAMVELECLSS